MPERSLSISRGLVRLPAPGDVTRMLALDSEPRLAAEDLDDARRKSLAARDREFVTWVIHAHAVEVRACYTQALERDPTLRGRTVVSFVINNKGQVASSTVRDTTLRDIQVGRCVAQVVRTL